MKNINQSTVISTCRTVCRCVYMDFADVFLTCTAHSIVLQSFFGGQNWHLLLLLAPAAASGQGLMIRTRFSPLNSFHKCCRGWCAVEALPSLNLWDYKCISQLLQEHLPLVPPIRHPCRVDLVPHKEGIV